MRIKAAALAIAIFSIPLAVSAQIVVFNDDFESGLGQWTGKNLGAHSGAIVLDPFDPTNHVVTFLQPTSSGDIFSAEISVANGLLVALHFDYLCVALEDSEPGNHGGFVGYADDTVPFQGLGIWLVGTDPTSGADPILIDDGSWHTYAVTFDPYGEVIPLAGDVIRILLQDFKFPAGDVFFDNIRVELLGAVVVEESTWGRVKALYKP